MGRAIQFRAGPDRLELAMAFFEQAYLTVIDKEEYKGNTMQLWVSSIQRVPGVTTLIEFTGQVKNPDQTLTRIKGTFCCEKREGSYEHLF